MECKIRQHVDYGNLSDILAKQGEFLTFEAKKLVGMKRYRISDLKVVLETYKWKEDGITKAIFNKIPGITESGWNYEEYEKAE